jgi:hypothetical protein
MNAEGLRGVARPPLAVVSDGSGFHRDPESNLLTDLEGCAALLRAHQRMAASAVLVSAKDGQELTT